MLYSAFLVLSTVLGVCRLTHLTHNNPVDLVLYHFVDEQIEAQSVGAGIQTQAVLLQSTYFITGELPHGEITLSNAHLQVRRTLCFLMNYTSVLVL